MQHPDEGMIHTWLDGELSSEEAMAFEAHAAECEQCKAAIAEARGFIAASSRIVMSLDAVPGGVIPIAKPVKRFWYSSPQFRAAAAVLVVAGASFLVTKTGVQKETMPVADSRAVEGAASAPQALALLDSSGSPATSKKQQPVAANEAAASTEAAKLSTPRVAQADRARDVVTMKVPAPAAAAPKESDFIGKGVRGGTANGVARGIAEPAMKAADAASPRPMAFVVAVPELKIVHVDSSDTTRMTTYQSSSGVKVVLTDLGPAPIMSKTASTADESRQLAITGVASVPPPVAANTPTAQAAPAARARQEVVAHTINWVDPVTRRRYSLSGPVSVEELEAIKSRLLQAKH